MTRAVFTIVATIGLLLPIRTLPVRAQDADVITDSEAYAVYGSVLPARFSSGDQDLTHAAILNETHGVSNCRPRVPPEWESVFDSYKRENARSRTLSAAFDFGIDVRLMSLEDIPPARQQDWQLYRRLPNSKLYILSAVGFDETKTRALVSIDYTCGFDCGGGWTVLREKSGSMWGNPKDNFDTCAWIY